MKKIAVDVDHTLINCSSSYLYQVCKLFPGGSASPNKELKYSVIKDESDDKCGLLSKLIHRFTKMGKFSNYTVLEDSTDAVNVWFERGVKVYLLSSRPNFASLNAILRQIFSKSNLMYSGMILNCNNKAEFCKRFDIDCLIDDSPSNCLNAMVNGIKSICYNKPMNNERYKDLTFVDNWKDIGEIINRAIESDRVLELE